MATFSYKALSAAGELQQGNIEAQDRNEAMRTLERRGLRPVKLVLQGEGKSDNAQPAKAADKASGNKDKAKPKENLSSKDVEAGGVVKLKKSEIILFTEELSEMLGAGLQLEPALKVMESRSDEGPVKVLSQRLRVLVRDGVSFNVAIKRVAPCFGGLYISLVAAGEASGSLHSILKRQAEHMNQLLNLQNQVITAMIYPIIVLSAVILFAIFFMVFLFPKLVDQLKSMPGGKVPVSVNIIMGLSNFIVGWWPLMLVVLFALIFAFKWWKDQPQNKPVWDEYKFRIIGVGPMLMANFHVQFLETLSNLVGNGLPLLRALDLTRDATQNLFARARLCEVIALVGDGRSLSRTLANSGVFPPAIIDMITVGEQTGRLDESLRNAAGRADKQLANKIMRLQALMMPIVLIFLALMVGTLVYLMFNLMYQSINSMQR